MEEMAGITPVQYTEQVGKLAAGVVKSTRRMHDKIPKRDKAIIGLLVALPVGAVQEKDPNKVIEKIVEVLNTAYCIGKRAGYKKGMKNEKRRNRDISVSKNDGGQKGSETMDGVPGGK